ncbi:hypothetical protein ACFW04_011303 [Cataglyphis niger]
MDVLERLLYFYLHLLNNRVIFYKIIKIQWQLLSLIADVFLFCRSRHCKIFNWCLTKTLKSLFFFFFSFLKVKKIGYIAEEFEEKWNFINCGGALDAQYYNYKHYYSIVLMALVKTNYEFIFIDVGKNGRISDGGIIECTEFYKRLKSDRLNLPTVEETKLNFNFFLGEAFSLTKNFLRPFPQKELTYEKRVFNYRSRARNVFENAFDLLNSRFRILNTCINMTPKNA